MKQPRARPVRRLPADARDLGARPVPAVIHRGMINWRASTGMPDGPRTVSRPAIAHMDHGPRSPRSPGTREWRTSRHVEELSSALRSVSPRSPDGAVSAARPPPWRGRRCDRQSEESCRGGKPIQIEVKDAIRCSPDLGEKIHHFEASISVAISVATSFATVLFCHSETP